MVPDFVVSRTADLMQCELCTMLVIRAFMIASAWVNGEEEVPGPDRLSSHMQAVCDNEARTRPLKSACQLQSVCANYWSSCWLAVAARVSRSACPLNR